MKTLQAVMWALVSIAVLLLPGCGGRETVYVGQPHPKYVIVRDAPPPIVKERPPSPPSRRHVWVDGYWHWDGRRYVWKHGHWEVPPRGRPAWVPPRYEKDDRGYRYTPGRWNERQQEREKEGPPPRDGRENRGAGRSQPR